MINTDKLDTIMKAYGYTRHSRSGDGTIYNYNRLILKAWWLHCEIRIDPQTKSISFKFVYVTKNIFVLSSGECSPLTNSKHFKRIERLFIDEMIKL